MKKTFLTAFSGFALLFAILFVGCQQEDGIAPNGQISYRGAAVNCGTGLTTTYPTTVVCAGDNFTVSTVGTCGRWKIQETTTNAACNSETGWTDLSGAFICAGTYSYSTTTPRAPGVYHFRTVHLQNITGSPTACPLASTCTGFTGEQWCCFDVVVEACGCEDSFTSECASVDGCDHAITYTFVPEEDGHYKIQGGINGQATWCSGTSSAGLTQTGGPGPALVTSWEGDLTACETYTVTIGWDGTNSSTGNWSAKDDDGVAHGGNIVCDPLLCNNNGYVAGISCPE